MPNPSAARAILCLMLCIATLFAVGRSIWAQPACQTLNRGMAQMEIAPIALLNDEGRRVEFESFIADEPLELADGYQHICPRVIERTTILFRYSTPTTGRFHMHNVRAPLDIGFFNGDGLLFQFMVMHPYGEGDEILYGPMGKFQYALEARAGFFRDKGLSPGSSRLLLETLP